ncbi:Pyocin large subunit-like protein, partial [Pseudomonas asiatica]|nr:Pyocin large subunit-like protein [Pseudomonas asiatica]
KLKVDTSLFNRIGIALAAWTNSHDWTKDGGQFIPHAATWLNGKRWEDELPAAAGANAKPQASAVLQVPAHHQEMYPDDLI